MATLLDPDQLRTLVAIADSGSFTRAADEVHKTQSAVSMQMKRLEETLGRPLFERDGRLSRLTPDGQRLVEFGRRLIRLNEEAVASFRAPGLSGHVRLGTPDDYVANLPELLARFARKHPRVEVTVLCEPTSELLPRIERGEVDLSIITYVAQAPRARVFRRERLLWVGSDRHCVHEEPVVPLALGRPDCNWRNAALLALDEVGRPHRLVFTSWNASVVGQAVLEGLAVSVLPESAIRAGMRVLKAEEGFPDLPFTEIAMIKPGSRTSPVADALERHIVGALDNIGMHMPIAAE
jgi:DNA-binding transcriptional LysR family regulator